MSKKPTKILISTDSATIHTGLAETCRMVFTRLLEKYPGKYDIEQLGWFHHNPTEKVSWPIHQTHVKQRPDGAAEIDQADRYGQRSFEAIRAKVNPDIVWTNGDLWCFDHVLNSPTRNTFRLCCYYTIDGTPYWGPKIEPHKHSEWGTKLAKTDRLVVLTEWGVDVLHDSCPEIATFPIDVIYHPADPTRFKVLSDEQKLKVREGMYPQQLPRDAFVLGWVGRNQFRKMNYKMWEVLHYVRHGDYIECQDCGRVTVGEWDHAAMKPRDIEKLMMYDPGYDYSHCWHCKSENVKGGAPIDDIYLWLHMSKADPGFNADALGAMYKIADRITYTAGLQSSKGLPPAVLAQLISTWDGMLYLTGGEGFGIPAYESLMSGVPTIFTNYSSHADFCKHGGLPVRVSFIPELGLSIHRAIADTGHAVEQVLWAYRNREEFRELGVAGKEWTQRHCLDNVVDQWHTVFQEMMDKPLAVEDASRVIAQVL